MGELLRLTLAGRLKSRADGVCVHTIPARILRFHRAPTAPRTNFALRGDGARQRPGVYRRSRIEFITTKMLDRDIASPAISGLSWPKAASGIAATL